tara:strand:+ start:1085 stop:1207 length:123 start_codon:yes stop_codon:yes gene_type:complete
MRILLVVFFTFLGVNLLVDVLDSDITQKIQERNQTLEQLQ